MILPVSWALAEMTLTGSGTHSLEARAAVVPEIRVLLGHSIRCLDISLHTFGRVILVT